MEICIFCNENNGEFTFNNFALIIYKALQEKYSESLKMHYLIRIKNILQNKSFSIINFKLNLDFNEKGENLKKFYKKSEILHKLKKLTEYFRFHKDFPRFFGKPYSNIIKKFNDIHRRFEYKKGFRVLNIIEKHKEKKKFSL